MTGNTPLDIESLSVTVKAVRINGRKMTQAVFRQIQGESLVDLETCRLRGLPWGQVNYRESGHNAPGVHVLWQKENELRRCVVLPPIRSDNNWQYRLELFVEKKFGNWHSAGAEQWLGEYSKIYEQIKALDQLFIAV